MEINQLYVNEKELEKLLKQYYVLRLFAFGSILTEKFSDHSDVDLLVEFEKNKSIGLFEMMELKRKLQDFFGRSVDLVEKDGIINPYRREEILHTSRKIYG